MLTNRILKGSTSNNGYKVVELFSAPGKSKTLLLHGLVAKAYIPNPDNLPFINHKDENPSNCSVDNLEWCTARYNQNYGTCKERKRVSMEPYYRSEKIKEIAKENGSKTSIPVLQFTKEGEFIARHKSGKAAARKTNLNYSHIMECCAGKNRKTVGGYVWKYERSVDLSVSL